MSLSGKTVQAPRTILVVDDDWNCRAILKSVVEMSGNRVLEACSGAKAVRLVQDPKLTIDAAILDFNMPGLNGVDTLAALRAQRPGLRAILCSASPESECLGGKVVDALVFLQKPIDLRRLEAALQ